MPTAAIKNLDPTVLRQAWQAAQSTQLTDAALTEANHNDITLAAARGTGTYRLVYPAFPGCGGTLHSMDNLKLANALPNVAVQYINTMPRYKGQPLGDVEGQLLTAWPVRDIPRILGLYGLTNFDERAVLIDPDGNALGRYRTKDANFVTTVSRAIAQDQKRGVGRAA